MFLPGKRLDGGTTRAGALGIVGDPRWTPGQGSEMSFAGNAATQTRTLQTRRPPLQLKTGGIFVEKEFIVFLASKVMESEHPANLTESPNVEKGHRSVLKSRDELSRSCRTTTTSRVTWKLDTTSEVFLEFYSSSSCSTKSQTQNAERKKNSFPILLKFVDLVRRTNTI